MSNTTTLEHSERFKAYTLSRLLPEGDTLVLDSDQGVLSQMHQGEECMLREQQLLSPSEMYVVAALLDNYPDYCPYEVVLSEITGKSVEKCRDAINASFEETGTVDPVMRPVRNLLGRCRLKLRPFGIQVRSMVHTGYMLLPAKGGFKG